MCVVTPEPTFTSYSGSKSQRTKKVSESNVSPLVLTMVLLVGKEEEIDMEQRKWKKKRRWMIPFVPTNTLPLVKVKHAVTLPSSIVDLEH